PDRVIARSLSWVRPLQKLNAKMSVRRTLASVLLLVACGCSSEQPLPSTSPSPAPSPAPRPSPIRVLMLTATAGFRHDSIPTARQVMTGLAACGDLTVTATEDLSAIAASALGG